MLAVIGGMLNQDAADSLTTGKDQNGNTVKTFDPQALINDQKANSPGVTNAYYQQYSGDWLADSLQGDGSRVSNNTVGHEEYVYDSDGNKIQKRDGNGNPIFDENGNPVWETQIVFDGETGYRDDSFDKEYEDGDQPGAEFQADEKANSDLTNAGSMGATQPSYDPKDSTSAFIGKNAVVVSAGDINITACDNVTADMVTATISGGAYAGVGVGMAVGVLFSNILAYVEDDAVLSAAGDITVHARGESRPVLADLYEDENKALQKALGDGVMVADLTIRAVSFTAGGAYVGVGVAAGVVVLNSNIKAYIEGNVIKANTLTVKAESSYPQVIAATLAGSGGVVGVSASVATAAFNGQVFAGIVGDAQIGMSDAPGYTVGNVDVLSQAITDATTLAAAISAGGVAVNGAISLAVNRTRVETLIGQGVSLKSTGNVKVKSDVDAEADTYIVGVAVGGGAVGLSAAIAILDPSILSYIGITPYKDTPTAGAATGITGGISAANVKVENNVATNAMSTVLSVAGGGLAVNGNALLVFNNTVAYAAINRMPVSATGNIDVDAYMNSRAESILASVTVGTYAVGVTVSYVRLGSENVAMIDTTGVEVTANNINVYAGREGQRNNSSAQSTALAAAAGMLAVNANAAVADNDTINNAVIQGSGTLIAAAALRIGANATATANAQVIGIDAGGISVAPSLAVALLRSEQRAAIKGGNIEAGSLEVISRLNKNSPASSEARLITGSGAAIAVKANIAVAYGRSKSLAEVDAANVDIGGNITVKSCGTAGVLSEITNLNLSMGLCTANIMVGVAYSQATFAAALNIPQNGTVKAGSVNIETVYTTWAQADLTPSASGIQVSYANIGVNLALANAGSEGRAQLTGKGTLDTGSVIVKADGTATADALTKAPNLSVSALKIAANTVVAILSASQMAFIEDVNIIGGQVDVQSKLNDGDNEGAVAELGSNFESIAGLDLSLYNVDVNTAVAKNEATNHAYIKGAVIGSEANRAGSVCVETNGRSYARAKIRENSSLSLNSVGLTTLYAYAAGDFQAYLDTGEKGGIYAALIRVENTYRSIAEAETTQAAGGVKVTVVGIEGNIATSQVTTNAEAAIKGNGTINTTGNIVVKATGQANALSGVVTPKVNMSGIQIAANVLTSELAATQKAYIADVWIVSAGSITVESLLNDASDYGAKAILGNTAEGLSTNISIYGASVNTARATADAKNYAFVERVSIGDLATRAGALAVRAAGRSMAIADILQEDLKVGYVSFGTAVLYANANGDYRAYVDTTGAVLYVDEVTVSNSYTATAVAKTAQPGKGTVSGFEANVNTAEAAVGINAMAAIYGNGSITTPGAIVVEATGKATANAEVATPTVSLSSIKIAVNVISATLKAVQKAYVEGTAINAASVQVTSTLNNAENTGAVAQLGSSAESFGAGVTLAGTQVHTATATANNTNHAYISGSAITTSGAVTVKSQARSYANAILEEKAASAGLLTIGVISLKADASGDFQAYIDTTGKAISAASILVENRYVSIATAETTQAAGGVAADLVGIEGNIAESKVTTNAEAAIKGNGKIATTGNIDVKATGLANAHSGVVTPNSLSGIKIAANILTSKLAAVQKAYIANVEITKAGNLTVESNLNESNDYGAKSILDSTAKSLDSVDITYIRGTANTATAMAEAKNYAYLERASIAQAQIVAVKAAGRSTAVADISQGALSSSYVAIGVAVLNAFADGDYRAYVDSSEASLNVESLSVANTYTASATAKTAQPSKGSISGYGAEVNRAGATVGIYAEAGIKGNGTISTTGQVEVWAAGTATAYAGVATPQVTLSGVYIGVNVISANLNAEQKAYIDGTTVHAENIKVLATLNSEDSTGAVAELSSSASGIGASVNLVGGKEHFATATANNTNQAYISGANIIAGKETKVESLARSYANARVKQDDINAGLYTLGVTVVKALAQGNFAVYVNGTQITAGSLTVKNSYSSQADAVAVQPAFGVTLASANGNYAYADVSTTAAAYVKDSNVDLNDGSMTVGTEGVIQASAKVQSPMISASAAKVDISVAEAHLRADQSAYISGGSIMTNGTVTLYSWQNKGLGTTGAVAALGNNTGGTGVGLIGAAANVAKAIADAANQAYVKGSNLGSAEQRNGNLVIWAEANSYAKAGFINNDLNISGVSLGILNMTAEAKGIFKAYLDSTGAVMYVGDISVNNNYQAVSEAKSTQPGQGVGVNLATGQMNFATANTAADASAYLTGSGTVNAQGISIQAVGSGSKATADIDAAKTTVSGVSIAANQAKASLQVVQNAYISGSGLVNASGPVIVLSILEDASAWAEAGANGGTNVNLVGGSVNSTRAESASKVNAYIAGNVTIDTTGDVSVGAELQDRVTSRAQAQDTSVTLFSVGVVEVYAVLVDDRVSAYIAGNANVKGLNVDVIAIADGTATAIAEQPNTSVSGVRDDLVYAEAKATYREVTSYIGSDAKVVSTGSGPQDGVQVAASSITRLDAYSNHNTNVSLVGVGRYVIKTTVGDHITAARIDGKVQSQNGISLTAEDSITASATTTARNAGAATAGRSEATSIVNQQKSQALVGAGAVLEALGDINILAQTTSELTASVNSSSVALGDFGAIYAATELQNRTTSFKAGDGARIVSRYGDVNISVLAATAKQNASTTMGGYGVYGEGTGPEAKAYIKTNTTADIGNEVEITALFGNLNINATSQSDIYAYAYRHMGALAGSNASRAIIYAEENTSVTIGGSGKQSYLNSTNTDISAYLYQKLHAYAVSYTISAGSKTDAYAEVKAYDYTTVNINNAYIGGIDSLNINAAVMDMYIHSESYAEVVGVTGKVYATSFAGGNSDAAVLVGSGADLAGQNISIRASSPYITDQVVYRDATAKGNTVVNYVWKTIQRTVEKVVKKVSKIPIIGWIVKWVVETVVEWVDVLVKEVLYSDEKETVSGTMDSTGRVDINGRVHLGGAAAGMYIDIKENGDIVYSGLQDGYKLTAPKENDTIILGDLVNDDLGAINISASNAKQVMGQITLFLNSYLPRIVINNWSDYHLVLGKVQAANGDMGVPSLNIGNNVKYVLDTEIPELTITSHKGKDLTFGKSIDVGDGSLTVNMNGGNLYTAANEGQGTAAAVWANRLVVSNAGSIGSAANRFKAYIVEIPAIPGTAGIINTIPARATYVAMEALDNIYAELSHVVVRVGNEPVNADPVLTINRVAAGGTVDLLVNAPQTLKYASNAGLDEAIEVSTPGRRDTLVRLEGEASEVVFTDEQGQIRYTLMPNGMIKIGSAITIRGAHYHTGDSQASSGSGGGTRTIAHYYLPNGDMVAVDRTTGKIVNVISFDGRIYDLDAVEFGMDGDKRVIRMKKDKFDIVYRYDPSGNLIDVQMQLTEAHLADGLVTIFVEAKPGELGWILPDGTRVYYKNAFLKTEQDGTVIEVRPILLGRNGENYLFLLEPLNGQRKLDFYHVVEMQKTGAGEEYKFIQGHVYTKEELVKASVIELDKGMSITAAQQVAQNILNSYSADSIGEGSTAEGIAAAVLGELERQLSSDWSFKVEVAVTAKNISVTGASGTEEKTIIDTVDITITLTQVVDAGATPETATFHKTINVADKNLETTGNDSSSKESTGSMSGGTVRGIRFAEGDLGNRSGIIFINKPAGSSGQQWLTVKNGGYYFDLVYDEVLQVYMAQEIEEGTYVGSELARYNELLGKYFMLSSDETSIQVIRLNCSGSGEISSSTLNGGYHKVNGGYLFVDDPAVTDANSGILYLVDRAVVVTPDGQLYPVAIEGNQIGGDQSISDVTISFAPGMQQMKDSDGKPLYNNNGEISTVKTENSIPVYDLQPAKRDSYGNILYHVYDNWTGQYVMDYSTSKPREFTEEEANDYVWMNGLFGFRYKVSVIKENIKGLVIVRPKAGGFTVTYTTPTTFDISRDDQGYGIIGEHMRLLMAPVNGFAAGTVLYLDDNKNVVALLTTNGEFYRYEQNTSFTPGNDDDQEIYTSYRSQGSDSNLDLIAEISAGSQTMLHEVMTGLYMSVPGEGSEAGPMNSFYAKADYFGFDNEGNLVLLEKSIDTFEIEDDKYGFNGAKVLIIKNAQGNVLLRILELRDNRIVFLFEDNTWFDSNDDTGFIPRAVDRSLAEYSGNSQIHLNGVQAGTVNISYAGEHTILTDNGGDNTNIIADNITIASQGNGNVFSAENPLVIRPYTTDAANVKLKLVKADAGEAFNASAYIVASGAGGKVDLHDTQIGSSGLLDLLVSAGAAELNNVGIHVGGNMKLSVNSGDVTMKQVEVEGSMTAKTDAGNININELDVSGTLGIETGGGDISMKDVDVSGSMTSMSSAGAIGIDSLNIGGNGTLDMQTGNGNITMDKVDAAGILKIASGQGDVTVAQVNSDGTLQITAANGSLLMKDEDSILTIGPNSTAGIGDTWLDIGGDIGTAQLPFKLNILLDKTGNAQPLNIKNVVNIYLLQETGESTTDDSLPTSGRDKNGTLGDHDETINGLENEDEMVKVTMPAQSTEELVEQLNNGSLTGEQLLALISGILKGQEIKALLGIDDEAVEALVASLETMETTELAALVISLNLGVAEPESKLDLTVLEGNDPEAIKNLAAQLGLQEDAGQDLILARLRIKLGLEDTAGLEDIKTAYESYYAGVLAQYRSDVISSYRASIENKLNAESGLSDADIRYLLDLGLSEGEAAIAVLLAAALEAQQAVVEGYDSEGNPIYKQVLDEEGNPLFIEGTDENGDPIQIPVYVMESKIKDDVLFGAYWQSLTEAQKQELIEAAWALADYPEPADNSDQYRVLIINIGKSTGKSSISNLGDIIVTQQNGTFTAENVFSRYGDVSVTSPDIAGVEGRTNVTGDHISLTATTGSITGLNVDERAWPLTTIGNIIDEDKKNQAYGQTGDKTWILVRNAETGEIEMQFAIDYTSVRDLRIENATSITASAAGDIEINEVTGHMGVNLIQAGNQVKLTAPGSIYDVRTEAETGANISSRTAVITAGGSVGTSQDYIDTNVDGTVQAQTGGDININSGRSLTLVADSGGQVNVNTAADLNLSNTNGNLVIGTINAGGQAAIISVAAILAGDSLANDVHIKANSIDLAAQNGSLGTAAAPIYIDTKAENGGSLSARTTNGAINISERNGDLIIGVVEGNGTVNISAAGGIQVGTLASTGGGDVTLIAENGDITETDAADYMAAATEAKIKASQARSAADLAAAQVIILQNYVNNILPGLLGRPAAQQSLDTAEANLAAARQELDNIKALITAAQEELIDIQLEKQLADNDLAAAEADLAQAIADREGLTDPDEIAEQDRLIAELQEAVEAARLAADSKQKELDDKNAEIAALKSQESEMETVTIPELTRIRNEAKSTLDGIDAQLAQAQTDLVDSKAAERDSLKATAQALEAIAAAKLEEARRSATTITTEGNLNLQVLSGGAIGREDNSLGITAAGTVAITTGTGTCIYGLYLESGGDLYLAPVTVDGEVLIDSIGNIKGMTGHQGTVITATNVALSSLGGDIGAASLPLLVNVDRLTAVGEEVYIKNLKDLTIDTVAGSTVSIEVSGNIAAGSAAGEGNGNNIMAEQLNLQASGSIGSEGNPLDIDTDQITVESKDLYLENNSGKLQINSINVPGRTDIQAAGSVVDGGAGNIRSSNLKISAFGDVGQSEDSFDVTIPDTLTITTSYGSINLKNWYKPYYGGGGGRAVAEVIITDPKTGVTVSGQGLDEQTEVLVTINAPDGQDSDQLSKFISQLANQGMVMLNYSITLNRSFEGSVTVNIPVGMEFEGKTLTIISYQDGKMYVFDATVREGMLSFETDNLSSYVVLDQQYTIIPYHGEYTQVGGKEVPMGEEQFQDVKADHWYFTAVAYMHALKIMKGVAEGWFEPHGTATRSMLATILYRLEGSPKVSGNSNFTDVETGSWYADAVLWADSRGIIQGYGNTLFGSNDPITREQLVVFLYRYSMIKGRDISASSDLSGFTDSDQISDYAMEAMKWAVALGLIQGKGENNLDPLAFASRAEIAVIMQRYIDIYAKVLLVDDDLLEVSRT